MHLREVSHVVHAGNTAPDGERVTRAVSEGLTNIQRT